MDLCRIDRPDHFCDGTVETIPTTNTQPMATHLRMLESEAIYVMREMVAECERPVMLYSMGKDSSVLLHLARKAFFPAAVPFPLLHVDTAWKFRQMYEFREKTRADLDVEILVHQNLDCLRAGINPFTHGSNKHTNLWKTEGLKQALTAYGFDCAFGGARRDEERSRAKERFVSVRSADHRWDPRRQRPELWQLYNTRLNGGETLRVFPLSNWTEIDIWRYIHEEGISVVPLYFAEERPVVEHNGINILVDDDRVTTMLPNAQPQIRRVRFRTLGCYPLTGAVESEATTVPEIIDELMRATTSERVGRMIDKDVTASMEKKKRDGYF